ncbi:MAG: cytochrome c biogenesis protein ResB [Deltaproteobacteria bacterium]|nr:cytochrome c biogenesis protein ResB [Deltaproteobacteria bacterium]
MEKDNRAWYRKAGGKAWYFFNSLKLTLFVLITLAIVSIFGTVVEQNLPIAKYHAQYGAKWTKIILMTGVNDMYHANWFVFLLALLTVNIIVCTFERFPPKWKSLLTHKPSRFDPRVIDKCAHHHTITLNENAASVRDRVTELLKKKKFNIEKYDAEGAYNIYAWRGTWGRLGSDVVHISLLLILLGAIVGSFAGYKDYATINVGDVADVPYNAFKVRLDKFWIEYYDTGQIRQYNSNLTVIENGKEVLKQQIWVNEPLYYKGVRFYQSSYGPSWNKVESADIALVKKKTGDAVRGPFTVKWGETVIVPKTPYSVKLVDYVADFAYDEKNKIIYSQSPEANNPAVGIEVYEKGKVVSTPWLFLKYPGVVPALPDKDNDLMVTGYRGVMYSGISLNKDPGTNIVWAGSVVMALGFIMAFFVFHRRVWVHIRETGSLTEVKIGGMINKNNLVLEEELKNIADRLSGNQTGPDKRSTGDRQ